MEWILVLAIGLIAGTLGGVVGFGTGIMLLPALVVAFGPLEAVPIMAITAIMANVSRVTAWWRDVDWKVCAAYGITAVPAAALGATTLVHLSSRVVELALGIFFLVMIPARRWLQSIGFKMKLWQMPILGAVIGYLSGIVVSTGPINTPFFLAYGLVKGAYLATEATGSVLISLTKTIVFNRLDALPWAVFLKGVMVGSSVTVGSYLAKRYVMSIDPARFRLLMDGLMLIAGVTMIVTAFV
jgi:uncharacterized protein